MTVTACLGIMHVSPPIEKKVQIKYSSRPNLVLYPLVTQSRLQKTTPCVDKIPGYSLVERHTFSESSEI